MSPKKSLKMSPAKARRSAGVPKKFGKRFLWVGITALLGLTLVGGYWWFYGGETGVSGATFAVPSVNLDPVEKPVADKIKGLLKQVEAQPQSPAAWGKLAMNLDVHEFKREAITCYRRAVSLNPGSFRWRYYGAIALQQVGSPEGLSWFRRAQQLRPDYAPLYVLYGQALLQADSLDRAEEVFRQGLAMDSTLTHARVGLARIALARGELSAAESHLIEALRLTPRYGEAHGLLGEVYRRSGRVEAATREQRYARQLPEVTPLRDPLYRELLAEGVSSFWHHRRGRAYLEKGQYAAAVRELEQALAIREAPEIHDDLGIALQRMGQFERAAEHHRAALAVQPQNPEILNNLATALYEMGETEAAIRSVQEALHLRPDFPEGYLNLGTFYLRAGRYGEAIRAFRQGLRRAPDHPRMTMKLAWALATAPEAGDRNGPQAVRLARRVCRQTGYRIPETLDVLAAAYARTGRFEQAVQAAQQALLLAKGRRSTEFMEEVNRRLQLYRAGQAYSAR